MCVVIGFGVIAHKKAFGRYSHPRGLAGRHTGPRSPTGVLALLHGMPQLAANHRRRCRAARVSLQGALLWRRASLKPHLPPGALSKLPGLQVDRIHRRLLYFVWELVCPLLCSCQAAGWEARSPGVPPWQKVAQPRRWSAPKRSAMCT